jgi:hypothetical protein
MLKNKLKSNFPVSLFFIKNSKPWEEVISAPSAVKYGGVLLAIHVLSQGM